MPIMAGCVPGVCARTKLMSEIAAQRGGLVIQVVHYFHVIAEEAERGDDDIAHAVFGQRAKVVEDVGFEPGLSGGTAAALPDEIPFLVGDALRRHGARSPRVVPHSRSSRHGSGILCAVKTRRAAARRSAGMQRQGGGHTVGVGGDETFVRPKGRQFVDHWRGGARPRRGRPRCSRCTGGSRSTRSTPTWRWRGRAAPHRPPSGAPYRRAWGASCDCPSRSGSVTRSRRAAIRSRHCWLMGLRPSKW